MASPPEWLSQFVNAVARNIHSHDVLPPLGCHFHQAGSQTTSLWEITIFASRTEIVGGAEDGRGTHSGFNVDVASALTLFSKIDVVEWQTQSLNQYDELGSHLSIEGLHANRQVWLRITASAPDRFEAGRRALVNQQEFEEIW